MNFKTRLYNHGILIYFDIKLNVSYFITNWLLSTNHKRIAVMYFAFLVVTAFSGILLATVIRVELSIPGVSYLNSNSEKYLTIVSLHGLIMVFFVVIPALFGAFGNFLLPTQLGVRDVAFPRLNSFMFWVTPSGFVLLLHIFFFDKNSDNIFVNTLDRKSFSQKHFLLTQFNNLQSNLILANIMEARNTSKLISTSKDTNIFTSVNKKLLGSILELLYFLVFEFFELMLFITTQLIVFTKNVIILIVKNCLTTFEYILNLLKIVVSLPQTIIHFILPLNNKILNTNYTMYYSKILCIVQKKCWILRKVFTCHYTDCIDSWSFYTNKYKLNLYGVKFLKSKFNYKRYNNLISAELRLLRTQSTNIYNQSAQYTSISFKNKHTDSSLKITPNVNKTQEIFESNHNTNIFVLSREFTRISGSERNLQKNNWISTIYTSYLPLYKKNIIKVSSWASNQLIAGWAFITPYSSRLKFSAIGKVDVTLIVVFAAGAGSIFSAINYIITYRCLSAPSSKNRKEVRSFFVDSLMVGSRMMLAANPALLIAILFLLSDRHLGTSIFDFSGGGDAVLFQHLFWFFGHPEVYIIIIPCFGFANSLMPHFLRKRLSGRLSLQFSMYTIAFMGFAVWGHHMYMVGLANTTRTLYSTMTVMISVPASTKVLHWCVTLVNSAPTTDVSFFFILSFTYFFTLGGLSGMFNAHIGFDVSLHDTFFVIGHFHVMLAGAATSCIFAAFYFYFGAIFGVQFSKVFANLHFFFYFFGQLFTVIPMIWLGYSGMPRRIMDYPSYFGGWHSVISGGHVLSVIGFLFFLIMLFDSFYCGKTPKKKTLGISRLGTRFAFYAYERKKLTLNLNTTSKFNKTALSTKILTPSKESINYTITFG